VAVLTPAQVLDWRRHLVMGQDT